MPRVKPFDFLFSQIWKDFEPSPSSQIKKMSGKNQTLKNKILLKSEASPAKQSPSKSRTALLCGFAIRQVLPFKGGEVLNIVIFFPTK